jgi:hypothetical protein
LPLRLPSIDAIEENEIGGGARKRRRALVKNDDGSLLAAAAREVGVGCLIAF